MTKIPFSDPIWDHLSGAYGTGSSSDSLRALCEHWDQEKANALFWDELYHQGSLYPFTYAALPYLWEAAPRNLDNLYFFSTVVAAAYADGDTSSGKPPCARKLNGLPLVGGADTHSDCPQESRLVGLGKSILSNLQNWFVSHAEEMAMSAYTSIEPSHTRHEAAYLSEGYCTLKGCPKANWFLQMLADECSDGELEEALAEMEEPDLEMLLKLAADLDRTHPEFAGQIRTVAGPTLEQSGVIAIDPNTPDLFG